MHGSPPCGFVYRSVPGTLTVTSLFVTHCAYLLQHACNEHAIQTPLMPSHNRMD